MVAPSACVPFAFGLLFGGSLAVMVLVQPGPDDNPRPSDGEQSSDEDRDDNGYLAS